MDALGRDRKRERLSRLGRGVTVHARDDRVTVECPMHQRIGAERFDSLDLEAQGRVPVPGFE